MPVQPVLRNGIRIENIRPASLSITATLLKVTHRLPDGELPKGTIRLKEDRVFVVDDRLFHRGKREDRETEGRYLPIPDDFCCDADVHAELLDKTV